MIHSFRELLDAKILEEKMYLKKKGFEVCIGSLLSVPKKLIVCINRPCNVYHLLICCAYECYILKTMYHFIWNCVLGCWMNILLDVYQLIIYCILVNTKFGKVYINLAVCMYWIIIRCISKKFIVCIIWLYI